MGKELQYTFTVSPETIGSGYSGGIYNYETVSNKYYSINGKPLPGTESPLDYTVSTTDVWITPDKAGKTIKVAENLNTAPRNGKVLFTQAESGRTYILPVQQSSATTRQTLQISTTAGNIPAAGGNKVVTAVLSTYYNDHRDPDKKRKCNGFPQWNRDGIQPVRESGPGCQQYYDKCQKYYRKRQLQRHNIG